MNFILFNFRNGNQINKKQKNTHVSIRRQPFLPQYVFYAILNTDLRMNRGAAAANVSITYILHLILNI